MTGMSKALSENLKLQMPLCLHSSSTLPVTASAATLSLLGTADDVGVVKYLSIVISGFNTVGGPWFTSSSCSQSNNLYDKTRRQVWLQGATGRQVWLQGATAHLKCPDPMKEIKQ